MAYILSYICAKLFFAKVVVKNQFKIPSKGPLIFVANHGNMILDPGMVRFSCKRNLHYLAKHTLFNNPLVSWIFKNANAIPVYRKEDDPSLVTKNEETFDESIKLFEEGKCLILFPEGISISPYAILKIKTGAARIALNAEVKNNFTLNLKIIPVGINYSDPQSFKSDVYIHYGDPISIGDIKNFSNKEYKNAVDSITKEIEDSLLSLTTNLSFIEMQDTISYLGIMYKNELFLKNLLGKHKKYDDFTITKDMIDAVEWYLNKRPESKEYFESIVYKYMRYLERLKLDDRFIVSKENNRPKILPEKPLSALWFFTQLPIYVYGLINNVIPYNISINEVNIRKIDDVEVAQYKFFLGGAIFILFYIIQTGTIYYFTGSGLITLLYFLLLIPTGNFALYYHNKISSYLMQFRFFRIFYKRNDIIEDLKDKRDEIIDLVMRAINEHKGFKNEK